MSVSTGVVVLAVLAQYLKRRRKTTCSQNMRNQAKQQAVGTPLRPRSPNGGILAPSSPSFYYIFQSSFL